MGADPDDLAFVPTPPRESTRFSAPSTSSVDDEILITDHGYNACRNAAGRGSGACWGALVTARIPFPIHSPDVVVDAIVAATTRGRSLLLVDHVTSPTGLVFPVERIVAEMTEGASTPLSTEPTLPA